MGIEHEEMNRIIFRESAGNDKLVQKAREGGRLSSIKFDVLRAEAGVSFLSLYIVSPDSIAWKPTIWGNCSAIWGFSNAFLWFMP